MKKKQFKLIYIGFNSPKNKNNSRLKSKDLNWLKINLDESKEFNSINRDHLKTKLKNLGFSKPAISMINNFMSKRQQKNEVSNTESDRFLLHHDVPQGTILDP